MAALRAGEYVPPQNDSYDPNADMRALQGVHKRKVVEQDTYLSKEQLQELRKVQQERIQVGNVSFVAGNPLILILRDRRVR